MHFFFRTLSVAPGVFQKPFGVWHSKNLVMTAGRCRKCSGRHWWNLQFGQMMRNQNQWSMPRTGHGWGFGSPIVAGISNYTRKLSWYHVYLVHKLACDFFGFWNAQGWGHFAACSEFWKQILGAEHSRRQERSWVPPSVCCTTRHMVSTSIVPKHPKHIRSMRLHGSPCLRVFFTYQVGLWFKWCHGSNWGDQWLEHYCGTILRSLCAGTVLTFLIIDDVVDISIPASLQQTDKQPFLPTRQDHWKWQYCPLVSASKIHHSKTCKYCRHTR